MSGSTSDETCDLFDGEETEDSESFALTGRMAELDALLHRMPTLSPLETSSHRDPVFPLDHVLAGKYRLTKRIRGGMSDVYLAEQLNLNNKPVVIKAAVDKSDFSRGQFESESKIIATLSHPRHDNIGCILDRGMDGGIAYLVHELVEGESLQSLIQNGSAFPPSEMIDIAMDVATGLQYAHSLGVIHRDIKPSNLMITSDGTVKIIDFGIALLHQENSEENRSPTIAGTRSYMSPEQRTGEQLTAASDLYSLGIVLRKLIVLNQGPVPKSLQKIVTTLTAESVERRYQNADELIEDLRHCLGLISSKAKPMLARMLAVATIFVVAGWFIWSFASRPSVNFVSAELAKLQTDTHDPFAEDQRWIESKSRSLLHVAKPIAERAVDGSYFQLPRYDGLPPVELRMLAAANRRHHYHFAGAENDISADGKYHAWVSDAGWIREIASGDLVYCWPSENLSSVAFSPTNKNASPNNRLVAWMHRSHREPIEIRTVDGYLRSSFTLPQDFQKPQMAWLPDGKALIFWNSSGALVISADGSQLALIRDTAFRSVHQTQDRAHADACGFVACDESNSFQFLFGCDDGTVRSWNPNDKEEPISVWFEQPGNKIAYLRVSPNGKHVFVSTTQSDGGYLLSRHGNVLAQGKVQ